MLLTKVRGIVRLVWYRYSVAEFFHDGQNLFEFAEVLEYSYASLCHGVDDSALAYGSFLD
jgi:hypothetical protein